MYGVHVVMPENHGVASSILALGTKCATGAGDLPQPREPLPAQFASRKWRRASPEVSVFTCVLEGAYIAGEFALTVVVLTEIPVAPLRTYPPAPPKISAARKTITAVSIPAEDRRGL